jgi:hypothetical protein
MGLASGTRVTASSQLPALIGSRVELHGVAGFGKPGDSVLVDGEVVDLRLDAPFVRHGDDIGKPMVVRGVLRHTGPIAPPPGREAGAPCPIQSEMETCYLENASPEFVDEPPPALASQVGKWVLLRGDLEPGKAGLLIVTAVGPVYLEGHVDPALHDQAGARVFASGFLQHASAPPRPEGSEQVAGVAEYFFLRDGNVQLLK